MNCVACGCELSIEDALGVEPGIEPDTCPLFVLAPGVPKRAWCRVCWLRAFTDPEDERVEDAFRSPEFGE